MEENLDDVKVGERKPRTVLENLDEAIAQHRKTLGHLVDLREKAIAFGIKDLPHDILGSMVYPGSMF